MKSIKRRFLLAMTYAAYLSALGFPSAYAMTTDADQAEGESGKSRQRIQEFEASWARQQAEFDEMVKYENISHDTQNLAKIFNTAFNQDPTEGREKLSKWLSAIKKYQANTHRASEDQDSLTTAGSANLSSEAADINTLVSEFIHSHPSADNSILSNKIVDMYFQQPEGVQVRALLPLYAERQKFFDSRPA